MLSVTASHSSMRDSFYYKSADFVFLIKNQQQNIHRKKGYALFIIILLFEEERAKFFPIIDSGVLFCHI